eukprot:350824-Chlamydomonas_euryale.AAC.1
MGLWGDAGRRQDRCDDMCSGLWGYGAEGYGAMGLRAMGGRRLAIEGDRDCLLLGSREPEYC